MPPKTFFVRKGANKAVKSLNWAKIWTNKRLGSLLFIFSFLLQVNISAKVQGQETVEELLKELADKEAKLNELNGKLKLHKELALKEAEINQIQLELTKNGGLIGTASKCDCHQQQNDSWPSIASKLSPDLLAIFIGVVVTIFAWHSSGLSSIRDRLSSDISSVRDRVGTLETRFGILDATAERTTTTVALASRVSTLEATSKTTSAKAIELDKRTTLLEHISASSNENISALKREIDGQREFIRSNWQKENTVTSTVIN